MPRAKIKALEEVDPVINQAFRQAFANPGKRIVVAPGVSQAVATNLQVRMQAVRQGFLTFFHKDHEYYRAAECGRLRIEREYDPAMPGLRTVTLVYSGLIRRPSEIAAEYMENLRKNPQVHAIRD